MSVTDRQGPAGGPQAGGPGRRRRLRRVALAVGIALCATYGRAQALGLGEVKLHSALGEPLRAEIRLLAVRPGELDGLRVSLAPPQAFEQAGVERRPELAGLRFELVRPKKGSPYLRVTSREPVREPFLDFLVQVDWRGGHLVKEYTLLLDPPTFAPAAEGERAPAGQPAASPAPAPAASAAPAKAPAPPKAATSSSAGAAAAPAGPARTAPPGSYGPTTRHDTLWRIAQRMRPPGVSVQRMAIALLRANPEAFYGDNINRLKAGYVLRRPDQALLASISEAEALREVAAQNEAWRALKAGRPLPRREARSGAEGGARGGAEAGAGARAPAGARLELAVPGRGEAAAGAPGGKAGDQTGRQGTGAGGQAELAKLRNDLALALEAADSAHKENEELRQRLAALEEQIQSLQKMLNLKEETLAAIQRRLQQQAPAPAARSGPQGAPASP
ncbi:MAG: hypothetical protein D6809_03360, partial [Gammaproteobacteria bacterium]